MPHQLVFAASLNMDPQTDAVVINASAMRLKGYFDRIIQKMNPKTFTSVQFGTTPAARSVTNLDLLVYVVARSLITAIDPSKTIHSPGGATASEELGY